MNGSNILKENIQKSAKEKADSESIVETETDRRITFQELHHAVIALQQFFGEEKQTIVLATPGGITSAVIWLTSLIFGHLLIPISPKTTEFEYEELLRKHTPTILITETNTWVTKPHAKHLILSDIETITKNKINLKQYNKPTDGTVYLETSGSTGKPKGILLSASQIIITAENIINIHELHESDRGLTPLPFYHVNAPVVSLITAILTGSTIIVAPRFSASRFWIWVEKYQPTWISIVPTIVAILLKSDKPNFFKKSSIRFIRTASAPLPVANHKKFEEKFGLSIIETYGISEAASTIFANPLPPKKNKPGSVGLPLGITGKIVDPETGKKIKQGEIGEIYIKGKSVIDHYEDGNGSDSFEGEWLKTGDLGYFDEDGYLFLTGRKKEIIIRGGENILPREIEEILYTYPGINEVAVVGQSDEILGEKVVAFVVTEKTKEKDLAEKIKIFAKAKLSPHKVPAEVYIVDKLPRGKTNKIDRNALKKMITSG